jgi:hypothetical protein
MAFTCVQGYGHDGAAAIKIHPFFRVVDWSALATGRVSFFVTLCYFAVGHPRLTRVQVPSPLKLEDLVTDATATPSNKAKAKQAIQSRVFAVPPVCACCHALVNLRFGR